MRWLCAACGLLAAVITCSGLPESDVTMADLDGRMYASTSEQPLDVEFSNGGMHVTVCNDIDGAYRVESGRVRFTSSPWSTAASCSGPAFGRRNNREVWIRRLLEEGMLAHLDGDHLTLTADGHTFDLAEVLTA
jgi:hypothetical protein